MRDSARFHRSHAEARSQQLRRRVALEAARLMSEHGIRDYRLAKHKAARHVGLTDAACLPDNREVDAALREHQRLFHAEQPQILRERRATAREAMRFLHGFEPRLVGAVLDGTADAHSPVSLHVFEHEPEAVAAFLREHGIACEARSRNERLDRTRSVDYPVLLFSANGVAVDVTVFPHEALRQPPLSRIDERPLPRATLAALEALLDERA